MLPRSLLAALPLIGSVLAAPSQYPFRPLVQDGLDSEGVTVLKHSTHFPNHTIRAIRPEGFCDSGVEQWSGYLDTPNNRHFYFWFFESRNDPANDPVVLWLNGGPGCSSFTGLVMELGPCRVQKPDAHGHVTVSENPWSWNSNASIIFLDQPVGVGYSYLEKGDKGVWSTEAAAEDVHALLQIWFNAFDKDFGSNKFHIAGESFAGRYIPTFSDYIVQQNKLDNGLRKINLQSIMVGNGMTHPYLQYPAYYPTVCSGKGGYGPVMGQKECETMAGHLPKCTELLRRCAANQTDAIMCLSAVTYCEKTQTEPFYATGRNAYDMMKFGDYDEEAWMATWLNQASTMHALGVDKLTKGRIHRHTGCDPTVGYRFAATGDGGKPSYQHVANVLDNGVAALMYSGDRDFICNWLGNQDMTNALEWSGGDAFRNTSLAPWYATPSVSGAEQHSGLFRTAGNLTFATVARSGHFVPFDQPQASLNMANAWLHYGPAAFADVLSGAEHSK